MKQSHYKPAEQRRALVTFTLFSALDCILLLHHRKELPTRDIVAVKIAALLLFVIPFLISYTPSAWRTQTIVVEKTPRFRAIFSRLSLAEIFFTVIIPWVQLLLHVRVAGTTSLALPHLFVFQAQIALESLILAEGNESKFALFPFTVVANVYRFAPIAIWWMNSLHTCSNSEPTTSTFRLLVCCELMLPSIALLLWSYSTLVFIPLEWHPLLTHKKL